MIFYTLVLPSLNHNQTVRRNQCVSCRGDYTGWSTIVYSRSPLSEPVISVLHVSIMFHVGEITQGSFLSISILVLPSMNRNFYVNLPHFKTPQF